MKFFMNGLQSFVHLCFLMSRCNTDRSTELVMLKLLGLHHHCHSFFDFAKLFSIELCWVGGIRFFFNVVASFEQMCLTSCRKELVWWRIVLDHSGF